MSDAKEINDDKLPEGWTFAFLEQLVLSSKSDIVDGPFGSNLKASEYRGTGVPILRLQNIKRNVFIDKNIKYISADKAKELERHSFKSGDLIITKLGDPLGEACIVPDTLDSGIIVADLVRVRLAEDYLDKRAILYAINSKIVARQFVETTKGTTRPRVNLIHVRNLRIPLPPHNEQRRIVEEIEKQFERLDEGIAALKRVEKDLRLYRASVLKAACEGSLVPTEAMLARGKRRNYEPASELLQRILKERRAKWEHDQLAKMKAQGKKARGNEWKQRYVEPEEVSIGQLPELPEGWVWARAEQLCDFITKGTTPSATNLFPDRGEIPFIKVYNLTDHGQLNCPKRASPKLCTFGARLSVATHFQRVIEVVPDERQ